MNKQTFTKFGLNRGKVRMAILILSCFLGLIPLAQPSTHSQIGEQPQQGRQATSSIGVTASNSNPLQIALLHWYDANLTTTFHVSHAPVGVAFDGANTWVTNAHGSAVTKLRANDGAKLGTFSVGTNPHGVAFDGANIWVANLKSNDVTKLRAIDGTVLGTFPVGDAPAYLAFDGPTFGRRTPVATM
jgi:hypothetical protein